MYEITSIDTGKTVRMTERECTEHFGKLEFDEIKQGYLPHLVCIQIGY